MKNAINWFSIPVADYERAKSFYQNVLDIKMADVEMGPQKMAFFPADEDGVGGSLSLSKNFKALDNDEVTVYLSSSDLDESLNRVESNGGSVMLPKTQISSEFGYFGILIDSEGNKVGLHSYN